MKKRKGLSAIVSTLLLIFITIVAIVVVWEVINPFINKGLEGTGSCYKILDNVHLNNDWTCYNSSSDQMQFSIELKESTLKGVLVSIVLGDYSRTFIINNESSLVENVSYLGEAPGEISLPSEEGAKTYVLNNVSTKPTSIEIAAISEKKQCDVSDSIDTIYVCN